MLKRLNFIFNHMPDDWTLIKTRLSQKAKRAIVSEKVLPRLGNHLDRMTNKILHHMSSVISYSIWKY